MEVRLEDGWRAVQQEWVLTLSEADMELLQGLDVDIVERSRLEAVGMNLVRLRVDDSLDTWAELSRQLPDRLLRNLDRNHIYNYRPQSGPEGAAPSGESSRSPVCDEPIKVGVVDTGVDVGHSSFGEVGGHHSSRLYRRTHRVAACPRYRCGGIAGGPR